MNWIVEDSLVILSTLLFSSSIGDKRASKTIGNFKILYQFLKQSLLILQSSWEKFCDIAIVEEWKFYYTISKPHLAY